MNKTYCPTLRIEHYGGDYRIISERKLDRDDIMALREIGLLGYGQEFTILTPCDGSEKIDPSETIPSPLGKPYVDMQFYVYRCYDMVDSSD